jgi:hypothetical protein
LQDHWTEVVTDKAAHGELALFQIARNRRAQIAGIEADPASLPLAGWPLSVDFGLYNDLGARRFCDAAG